MVVVQMYRKIDGKRTKKFSAASLISYLFSKIFWHNISPLVLVGDAVEIPYMGYWSLKNSQIQVS